MNRYDLDPMVRAYLDCALWASTGDDDQPLDKDYDIDDMPQETIRQAQAVCGAFKEVHHSDIAWHEDQAGHDLWLTRNGHGVGFWDRPEVYGEEQAERLTKASQALGECYLYVGDDDGLYFSR